MKVSTEQWKRQLFISFIFLIMIVLNIFLKKKQNLCFSSIVSTHIFELCKNYIQNDKIDTYQIFFDCHEVKAFFFSKYKLFPLKRLTSISFFNNQ